MGGKQSQRLPRRPDFIGTPRNDSGEKGTGVTVKVASALPR